MIETDASKYLYMIPDRLPDSNKGTYGRVLILAGSDGMSGAAYLSALAAYRTGAGLVKFLTHSNNRIILQTLLPEAVYEGYDASTDIKSLLERNVNWADIIVLGPGLGTSDLSVSVVAETFAAIHDIWPDTAERKQPLLIVDADGLNIVSRHPELKDKLNDIAGALPVIITPHPMEMSRLMDKKLDEVLAAPELTASSYSKLHNVITLLKGSQTVISLPFGEQMFKNVLKSPALSKGGSGDVLSGTIAGVYSIMRASGKSKSDTYINSCMDNSYQDHISESAFAKVGYHYYIAYISTVIGMLIHSEAGREAARSKGVHGVLARDTAECLGRILDHFILSQDKGNS